MTICYPSLWQDWVELGILFLFIHTIQRWLASDTRIPLLWYSYSYSVVILAIYYANLTTLIPCIPIITPSLLMLALLLHKKSLQKDIIPYTKHINNVYDPSWLELVLRSSVSIINDSRTVVLLFEYTDELAPFITIPYILESRVQPELIKILLHPLLYTSESMLWITASGTIISNKAQWCILSEHTDESPIASTTSTLKNLSLVYTFKTNGLVCFIDQNNRTASLIVHGTQMKTVSIHQAYTIIAKHLHMQVSSTPISKALYEKSNTTQHHTT